MTINGVEYTVEYLSDIDMRLLDGCDENTLGNVNYHNSTISIKKDIDKVKMRRTLIHEIVHAVRFEYGLPREKNEEVICDFISAFYDIISDLIKECIDDKTREA
jgi:hypothetical protein